MKNSTLGEAVQLDQQAIDSCERMSCNTATKNTQKSKELPTDQGPEGSHDNFVDVVQQLLESQRREKEEERARWEQREAQLNQEKREERARWEEQQAEVRRDKEEETRRRDEEWTLRLEEPRLRTEALKLSEETAARARVANAERGKETTTETCREARAVA